MSMMLQIVNSGLGMMTNGPRRLAKAFQAAILLNFDGGVDFDPIDLRKRLEEADAGDPVSMAIRAALARWDAEPETADWTDGTPRNRPERRAVIYSLLGVDPEFVNVLQSRFPPFQYEPPVVIAAKHKVWYKREIWESRSFYWKAYEGHLRTAHKWPEDSLRQLDESTRSVVERLANPLDAEAYQSKGLVVGYVQSGKTANFTGVIAKAADAGYRLIIVLAGTLDVLRSQTQRRLDKDLIGKELLDNDYRADDDYAAFLSHGDSPSMLGAFDWTRLTGPEADYLGLKRGIDALGFERANPAEPFWVAENCLKAKARIAVVKKNLSPLTKLIHDLKLVKRNGLGCPLEQVPILIVDDESDQAGVNTRKPKLGGSPDQEQDRSSINRAIVDLLKLLPRAQYVGYTATPFANVFVDPENEADIFPKDFIVSLPRPSGYMGVSDFYDLEGSAEDPDSQPNKRDFVREVVGKDEEPKNLIKAIDSFVLAGALKIYRTAQSAELRYRHHTMLVHSSSSVAAHEKLKKQIEGLYDDAAYDGGAGLARLKTLFEEDFQKVSAIRAEPGLPFPPNFEVLKPHVAECRRRLNHGSGPILVINNENREQTPDFDKQEVWKILVGGTKLSRGYTVEGLTVSYYRRGTQAADTLMQMGRWFGFRKGYRDLVRLFIGTKEKLGNKGKKTINLYEAFGAICRDEEMFRQELRRYASIEDPRIRPIEVPPLVPSHMLRPTASNKMYNAFITSRNFGSRLAESTLAPTDEADKLRNLDALKTLVVGTPLEEKLLSAKEDGRTVSLKAVCGILSNESVIRFLSDYRWAPGGRLENFSLPLGYIKGEYGNPLIDDWLFFAPQIKSPIGQPFEIQPGCSVGVVNRTKREGQDRFNTYNDPKHRRFAEFITKPDSAPEDRRIVLTDPNSELAGLYQPRRGVLIYYPITEDDKRVVHPITTGFTLLFPPNRTQALIKFSVLNPNDPDAPVVSRKKGK